MYKFIIFQKYLSKYLYFISNLLVYVVIWSHENAK